MSDARKAAACDVSVAVRILAAPSTAHPGGRWIVRNPTPIPSGIWSMSLEFTLNQAAAADTATDCIVVGAFVDGAQAGGAPGITLTPSAQAIDAASGGRLAA